MQRSLTLALLAILIALPVSAATLTVDRNNAGCNDTGPIYCTIEAAIDDAVNGDVIDVVGGAIDYFETVIVDGESLTISSDDVTKPVIHAVAAQDYSVITVWPNFDWCISPENDIPDPPRNRPAVSSPNVTIQGLRLTGGNTDNNGGIRINGDDTIVLRKNTAGDTSVYETIIDVIGNVGVDPGNEWGSGANSTNRASLVRNSADCTADTNPADAFVPSAHYTGTALHHTNATVGVAPPAVADLGSHTSSCGGALGDLLFSQYVESYTWRNSIEIWNGTAAPIVLANLYRLEVYENGSSCPSQIYDLLGSLSNGEARVLSNSDSGLLNNLTWSSFEGGFYNTSDGGGVSAESSNVTIIDVEIDTSIAELGGGVGNLFGTVTITDSNIHDNTSDNGGGGVNNDWGTLTVNDTTIKDNFDDCSWECGGGIGTFGDAATTTVNGSLIEENTSDYGGGLYASGGASVTISDSTIRGNTSLETGAGIGSDNGHFTILRTTISGNTNNGSVGSGHNDGGNGGGIFSDQFGDLTITNSTISGNASPNSFGGGIHLLGQATLEHVTLYNNTAGSGGSQIWVDAMAYDDGPAVPLNQQGPITGSDQGDGNDCNDENPTGCDTPFHDMQFCAPRCFGTSTTATSLPAQVNFQNTIIATTGADPCAGGGVFNSLGNNLVYPTDAGCGADQGSDINGQNPNLQALADNGGPTETHAFTNTDPPFDAGVVDQLEDQRGVTRPQFQTSDIGAFELAADVSGVKSVSGDLEPGGNITYTIVLSNNMDVTWQDCPLDEFVDDVPSQVTVTGVSATSGTAGNTGNHVTWNGSLAPDEDVTITINATINPDAEGQIENSGTLCLDTDCNGTCNQTFGTSAPAQPVGPTVISLPAIAAIPAVSPLTQALLALMIALAALVATRMRT